MQQRLVGHKATKIVDINNAINKGKDFLKNNEIEDAFESEQAETMSDSAPNAGANFVKFFAPDGADDKIDGARDHPDKSIGTE